MAQEVETAALQSGVPTAPPGATSAWADKVLGRVRALGPARMMALGLILLAFAAFFTYVVVRVVEPRYTILFGGLELADSREIVERLEGMNVPYRLSSSGDAVMVPSDEVLNLRMQLAEDGLPGGGAVGYEIFDETSSFGTSAFLSDVNLKRALEGELARTISSLRHVRAARVHLVQPKRELFRREQTESSASIFLSLGRAGGLDPRQIAAIQHLVAAAVPELEAGRVTVLDDSGNLLARSSDGEGIGHDLTDAERHRVAYEDRLKNRIVDLLERSVGRGRVDAEVAVVMAFDELSTTEEIFDPESQVARSTQLIEEVNDRDERNPDGSVTVTNNLPTEGDNGGGEATSREQSERIEETTNYEISRTVRNRVRRGGTVDRISVAVQVDGVYERGADGEMAYQPRSEEELAELESLIRNAVGFNEERGDQVSIVSRQFVAPEAPVVEEEPFLGMAAQDFMRMAELGTLLITALLVLQFGLRPLIRRLLPEEDKSPRPTTVTVGEDGQPMLVHSASGATITLNEQGQPVMVRDGEEVVADNVVRAEAAPEEEEEEHISLAQIEGKVKKSLVNDVAGIIEHRPEDAVRVIRGWLHAG